MRQCVLGKILRWFLYKRDSKRKDLESGLPPQMLRRRRAWRDDVAAGGPPEAMAVAVTAAVAALDRPRVYRTTG